MTATALAVSCSPKYRSSSAATGRLHRPAGTTIKRYAAIEVNSREGPPSDTIATDTRQSVTSENSTTTIELVAMRPPAILTASTGEAASNSPVRNLRSRAHPNPSPNA
jgi:hypothetical protein